MLIVPFELLVGGLFLWTAAQAVRTEGPQALLTFVLPASLFFGWLEFLGSAAGRYRYHPGFHGWLGGAIPALVPLGVVPLLRAYRWVTDRVVAPRLGWRHPLLRAVSDGTLGVAANTGLDALAQPMGWWSWAGGRLPPAYNWGIFLGVAGFAAVYRGWQRAPLPRRLLGTYALLGLLGWARWYGYQAAGAL